VGIVGDGDSLLRAARSLNPGVVLLDVYMPLLNGLDAGQQLKSIFSGVKIIVLTVHEDPPTAAQCLRTWASGCLLKKSTGSELLLAIRKVLRGGKYIPHALQNEFAEADLHSMPRESGHVLTSRQREVLQLLARASL
jgi:DNA-binding NarL/FixJ family response regulator